MKIKNIAVKFFAAAMFVSYVGSASAAFTGDILISVNGSTVVDGDGNNDGVLWSTTGNLLNPLDGFVLGTVGDLALNGDAITLTGFFDNPVAADLNPFSNFNVSTLEMGDEVFSFGGSSITYNGGEIGVAPTSGQNNGSVDLSLIHI